MHLMQNFTLEVKMEPRPILRKNLGLIIKNDIIRENERLSRSPSYERCGMLSPYQDRSPLHSPNHTNRDFGMSSTRSQRDLLSPSYGLASVSSTSPSLSSHRDSFSFHRDSLSSYRDSLSTHRDSLSSHQNRVSSYQDIGSSHRGRLSSHRDSLSSHHDSLSSNQDSWSSQRDSLSSHRDTLSSPRDILYSTWQRESRARSPGLSYRSVHKYDEEILLSSERQRRSSSIDRAVPRASSLSYYREDRSFLDRTDLRTNRSPSPFSRSSYSDRLNSPFSERRNFRDVSPLVSQERLHSPNRNRSSPSVHDIDHKSPKESVSYTKQSHQDRQSVGVQRKQISSQENYFTPIIQDEKFHKDSPSHDTLSPEQACDVQHIPTQPFISSINPPAVIVQDEKSNVSDFSSQSSSQTFPNNQSTDTIDRQDIFIKTEESLHSSISKRSVSADEKMFLSVEGGHLMVQATGGAVVKSGKRTFSVMMGQPKRISEDKNTLERRLSLNESSLVSQKWASSFIEASSTRHFDDASMTGKETKSNKEVSMINDDCENVVKGPKDVNTGSMASIRDAGISKAEAVDLETEEFKKETGKVNESEGQYKLDDVTSDKMNAGGKTKSQSNKKSDSVKRTEVDEEKQNEKEGKNDEEKQYSKSNKDKASKECEERRARSGQREGRGQSRRLVRDQEDRRDRHSRSRTPVRFLLVSNKLETSGGKDSPCCVKDHSCSPDGKATTKSNESGQMPSKSQKNKTTTDVDERIATEEQKKKVPNEEFRSIEKISQVKNERQSHFTSKETIPLIDNISKAADEKQSHIHSKSSDIKQMETEKDAGQTHSSTESDNVHVSEKHTKTVVESTKSFMESENIKSVSPVKDEKELNHDTLMSRKKELAQDRTVQGKKPSSDCKVITLTLKPVAQERNLDEISAVKKEETAVNTKEKLAGDEKKVIQRSKGDTESYLIVKEVSVQEDKKATGKEIPVIVIKDEVVKRSDLESPKSTESKDRTDNQSNFGFNRERLFAKLDPRGYKIENLRRKSSSSSDSTLKSPDVFSEGKISPDVFSSGQYTSFAYSTEEEELAHKKEGMKVVSSSVDTQISKKGGQTLFELLSPLEPVLQKANQDPVQSNKQKAEELDQKKPNKKVHVDNGSEATQNENKQNSTDHNSMSKSIKDDGGQNKSDDTKLSVLESDTKSDRTDKNKTESKTVDDRKQAFQKDQANTSFKDLIRKTRSRLHGVSDDSESDQQNNTISKPQEMSPKSKQKQTSPDLAKHMESKSNAVDKLLSQEHKSLGSERNSKNGSEDRAKSQSSTEGSAMKVSFNSEGTSTKMLDDSLKGRDTKIGSPITKLKNVGTKMKQSEVMPEFKTSKEVPVSQKLNTKLLDESAEKGRERKQSEKEFEQKNEIDKDSQKENMKFKPQSKLRTTSETNEKSVNLTTVKTQKTGNVKNPNNENNLSVSTGNKGESNLKANQLKMAEMSSNSNSNIITKESGSSKDSGKDNVVSNRSDVKEVTELTEDRDELSSKSVSVTNLGSPKQKREKAALPVDNTQMTDVKVDLKQARANLQNKKKDKISSIETTAESRKEIVGKKYVADGNSKIPETTTMAPVSTSVVPPDEKEQKISSPKCLPELEKTEQVGIFEKDTKSPTLTKRRTDNSKRNVLDNKDTAGFKDVIGNMKASLKTKPKDTKSPVPEKESTAIDQLKKLDNSAQQKPQEKQLLEDKNEKVTTGKQKYDSTDKQKELTLKKGKETKEKDMSKTLDLENDKKPLLNKLQDDRKQQKLKMNITKSDVNVSEYGSTTIAKAEEANVTHKKSSNEKKLDVSIIDKKAQLNESVQTKSDDISLKDVISQTKEKLQKPSKSTNNKTDQCHDVKQSEPKDQDPIKNKESKDCKTKTQNFKDNESIGQDLNSNKARVQNVKDNKLVDQDLINKDSKARDCLNDKKLVDKDSKDISVQDVKDNKSIDQEFGKIKARDQCTKDTRSVGQDLKDTQDFKDNKSTVKYLKDINTKFPNFNDNKIRGQNLKVNQSKVKDSKDNKADVDGLKDRKPGSEDLTPGCNNLDHKKTGGTESKYIKLGDIKLTGNKSGDLDARDRELEAINQEDKKLVVTDIKNTEKRAVTSQDLKKSNDKTGGRDIQDKRIGQEKFKDSEKKFQGLKDFITAQDPSDKLTSVKNFNEDKEIMGKESRVAEYKEKSNSVNVKNYAAKGTKALGSNSTDNACSVKDSALTTKSVETRDMKLNENNAFDKKTRSNPNQINKYETELEDAQTRRALSNNLSKTLANKDLEEKVLLGKSASDNATNIMDKQTTAVSIKQEGVRSKNRHHTSKTADGKTIVPDTGNTKSISFSDVNLHSQADDRVHSTQNTGSSAKESKLVNQEKESNEMCQGTSMLGTHRKKQSNAKNEAEGIGVTESLSNLDRKVETSYSLTKLKTAREADSNTELKKPSRVRVQNGDKQDSSSEKKHVNNANVQDPPQEIKSVNIQPRISAKNRSVNSTETTHDVSKDNKSTKAKTDVSEESGKNKDSSTARKKSKSKVLREFVTINDVTPVSYTEHAEVKMKDLHESRANESIIARKPDDKVVKIETGDIKKDYENKSLKMEEFDLKEKNNEKSWNLPKISMTSPVNSKKRSDLDSTSSQESERTLSIKESQPNEDVETSTGNKTKSNKIDLLQTKTKGRHKFVLPALKSAKAKTDVKSKNENEDVYESGNDNGVIKNEVKGKLGETLTGNTDNKDIIESTKIDEKKSTGGEATPKSTLKVTFETKENYSTESEVNGSHQTKHQSNIKNTQYGKEVKHSSGSPKQTRKKMATAGNESAVQETQKKVQFKDVDKDYQRKVYAQEVAKKIQTSIIAEMRNKLRSKATAIEKHQERIKAKESKAVDNTSEPKVTESKNESEVKGRPDVKDLLKISKTVTGVALDKNVHSSEKEKTLQKVGSLDESLKKQEKEPSIISSNEKKHSVVEGQENVKSRQNEGRVTNKETKSIPSDDMKIKIPPKKTEVKLEADKKVSEFKKDSNLSEKDIQISRGVESDDNDIQFISTSFSGPEHDSVSYKGRSDKSSANLVNKNRTDVCEDKDKDTEVKLSDKGFFNVSKYITNTKIQEFKKKLNSDVTHSKKDEKDKLSDKDIQISKGVEPRQINDIQFISTSFSGPDSLTSNSTGSKEDQKSPELTYKRFDFDDSSESKSLSSDSTLKEEQVSDDEVEDMTNEDIMAELRKLLPLEIFSSRRRHNVEESLVEDDTPCDCCECQGSSDEEYSVDGRIPQLSVIGEEDEEAVSVFDPDNEEMEFHRKFMEKVYGRNPRASKVFNPGVIVESCSDSSENGETDELEIDEFEGRKKPVFDIEAFLKYTGNVEDWLERIEDLGNIPGMLLVTMSIDQMLPQVTH